MINLFYHFIENMPTDDILKTLPLEAQNNIRKYKRIENQRTRLVSFLLKRHITKGAPLTKGPYGKPLCDHVHFNVSHDTECVIAATANNPIGVDVMDTRIPRDIKSFHYVFTPNECKTIGNSLAIFYRFWTAKEAYIKMRGTGLHISLDTIEIRDTQIFVEGSLQTDCRLYFREFGAYQIAVCCENAATEDILLINAPFKQIIAY